MKTPPKLFVLTAAIAVLLAGCVFGSASEVTIFLVSQTEKPDAFKKFGCDEYLIPVKVTIEGEATVAKALNALFTADPAQYGADLITSGAIKDQFFVLDSVDPEKVGTGTNIVSLKRREGKAVAGVCDIPRVKEQIKETIRATVVDNPFIINFNGSPRGWDCFGDESGACH